MFRICIAFYSIKDLKNVRTASAIPDTIISRYRPSCKQGIFFFYWINVCHIHLAFKGSRKKILFLMAGQLRGGGVPAIKEMVFLDFF